LIANDTFVAAQMGAGWVYVLSILKILLEPDEALPDIFG